MRDFAISRCGVFIENYAAIIASARLVALVSAA